MSTVTNSLRPAARRGTRAHRSSAVMTLAVAVLGFFVITFDAVVVNVALPTIGAHLGGGIGGLQWVVDGYTLMFAALLLTSGALSDRVGARRAFTAGLLLFLLASLVCGVAPSLTVLVAARFVQGSAAAVMMPASMALIGEAYPDSAERGRAVAIWAMGAAVASSSGPVLGGVLTGLSWRLIFLLNLPVGALALLALQHAAPSPRRPAPLDWVGQAAAVVAMAGLTYGAIEAGSAGLTALRVDVALAVAAVALGILVVSQTRVRHPMIPPRLVTNRAVALPLIIGFAFMVGYYGLPFVFSLYFQQVRGLSALTTGALFLPMMLIGAVLTPFSARIAERVGHRRAIVAGLLVMAAGLVLLGWAPASAPTAALSVLMILVGLGGPLVMPPVSAVLLNGVHGRLAGRASGLFNTSRQVGGAMAVAVFGGMLSTRGDFLTGVRLSLSIAAAIAAVAAVAALRLQPTLTAEERA